MKTHSRVKLKEIKLEEIWKELDLQKGVYISNFGNISGCRTSWNSDGYNHARLSDGSRHSLHRLVAKHFVDGETEEKCDINHIDGNKQNNHYTNLEWCTHQYNMQHAVDNGRKTYKTFDDPTLEHTPSGNAITSATLSIEQVKEIKVLLAKGYTQKDIAKMYNVQRPNITMISNGKRWAFVEVDTSEIKIERDARGGHLNVSPNGFRCGDYISYSKARSPNSKLKTKIETGRVTTVSSNGISCEFIISETGKRKEVYIKFCTLIDPPQ